MFDLKRIQPLVDFMAETGRDKIEIDFDDLNDAIGEIERLRAEVEHWKAEAEAADALAPNLET